MARRLLRTDWRLPARIEEICDILGEAERLPEWWGAVYLDVQVLDPGGDDGIGRRISFHSRGRLPYTLRWQGEVIEADRPHGWVIRASGDLVGEGRWTLTQQGEIAEIRYDWTIEVGKPWMRRLTPLLWPAFAANHRWAMAQGLTGLRRELARRSA